MRTRVATCDIDGLRGTALPSAALRRAEGLLFPGKLADWFSPTDLKTPEFSD
jgi:hypothetical protein